MAGFRLRGYSVERLLGRGASSEVWRARVAAGGEPVALKRLLRTDAHQLSRAHAEAALLGVLDHPNLVRLHAVVPTPEAAVLVLDLADAGDLAGLLATRGRLAPGEVITALAPVAAALAYVHRHGVVHGDVSAANVLFTADGTALLADLGVARLTGDDADAESTPAYVDPSVAAGSPPVAVSDVFMLGAVALHALTGAPLWPGDTAEEMLAAARAADVSDVAGRLAAAQVPEAMAAIVRRALVVDPRRRCTAADFALELRHSGVPVAVELAAGRGSAVPRLPDEQPPPRRRVVYDARHAAPVGGPSGFAPDRTRVPPATAWSGAVRPGAVRADVVRADAVRADAVRADAVRADVVPQATAWSGAVRPGGVRPDDVRAAVPPLGVASPVSGPPVSGPPVSGPPGAGTAPWRAPGHEMETGVEPDPLPSHRLPPTSAVRRPRPEIPRPPRRRGNRRLVGFAVAAGLAVAAAAVVTASADDAPEQRRGNVAATVDWAGELRCLDQVRALAFARRDPALLGRVYPAGPLLTADAALLRRLVPSGCGLPGVVTRFTQVRVSPGQRRALLTVRAGIPATTLQCAGRANRSVAAVPARTVRIQLAATHNGVRIVELRAD